MSFITPLLPNQASIERIAAKSRQIMIGTYIIDAALTEEHNFDSDVTEYPVEQAGDGTDNIRPKPITVTIEGIVSDTPIGKMVDIRVNQGDNGQLDFTPSADALAALTAIRDARLPVPIVTSLKAYDNMAMTSLKIPRDAATGAALRFTADFQQIIFVTNNRTTVRVATPDAQRPRLLGTGPRQAVIIPSKLIIWRKGTPPGAPLGNGGFMSEVVFVGEVSGETISDTGVQIGTGTLPTRVTRFLHADKVTPLNPSEQSAFILDMQRDQRAAFGPGALSQQITRIPTPPKR